MTPTPQDPDGPNKNRTRIALAVLTGLLAGVARALTEWLVNHLGN
jgi:hypothetical protein